MGFHGSTAVAYIRVSTREQDEENQRHAIKEWAARNGVVILRFYVDKGESGAKPFRRRPGAARLLTELEDLKPDLVVAWSLDRIGRSMVDTMDVVQELEERGIRVVTVKEEFLQTMDPHIRKLILSILAWTAEYERRRIRERQLAAWEAGKQKGRPPKVPDDVLLRYLRKYYGIGISLKDVWRIMQADGYQLDYSWFLRRVKRLIRNGRLRVSVDTG